MFYTHVTVVSLFVLFCFVKMLLLFSNKQERLSRFTKVTAIPERLMGLLFLVTGIYLLTQLPEINSYMIIKLVCVVLAATLAVIGFKRSQKATVLIAFVFLLSAYGLAEVSKRKLAAGDIQQAATASGRDIFNASCAQCHGQDGKKGVMGATDLSITPLDIQTILLTVENGKGAMVGYRGILSEAQIHSVAEYVQHLKK